MERDPSSAFRSKVSLSLERTLSDLGIDREAIPPTEKPPEGKGHFAVPCFSFAKVLKKAPHQIAGDLQKSISSDPDLTDITVTSEGPYLNFTIDPGAMAKTTLSMILGLGPEYGYLEQREDRVTLEHTSANPNGPFHIGRARNPIIGDTLARVLKAAGFQVETQYWVNDMGKQAATLTWSLTNIDGNELDPPDRDKPDHDYVRYYQRAHERMKEEASVDEEVSALLRRYEDGDPQLSKLFREHCSHVLDGMVSSLRSINIEVDRFVWESDTIKDRTAFGVIEKLKGSEHASEEDGAWYLDLEPLGFTETPKFFFTRSDGTTLYTTRDLAYHQWKLSRCDRAINVLGEDHRLQAKQLKTVLEILGADPLPEVVFYAFISLPEGKMSTRAKRVVYLDDLIEEAVARAELEVRNRREDLDEKSIKNIANVVGCGAIRYNTIRVQNEKPTVFRWEEALNFEGDSAPFVQYAHARACSILRKAGMERDTIAGQWKEDHASLLDHPQEQRLIELLMLLPGFVSDCSKHLKCHTLASYARDVAAQFNNFYRDCPVISAENEDLKSARLVLVHSTAQVLHNTLDLLGIEAPVSM